MKSGCVFFHLAEVDNWLLELCRLSRLIDNVLEYGVSDIKITILCFYITLTIHFVELDLFNHLCQNDSCASQDQPSKHVFDGHPHHNKSN